jgi:hypothetical protein
MKHHFITQESERTDESSRAFRRASLHANEQPMIGNAILVSAWLSVVVSLSLAKLFYRIIQSGDYLV